MKKRVVIWLIVAAALILVGGILLVGGIAMAKWDFAGLSTSRLETHSYELQESIVSVAITSDTANIEFLPTGEGETASVVCHERQNERHTVEVKDGVLRVEKTDTRKWYEHIGVFFVSPKVTVYLPAGEYGLFSVVSDTGDLAIPEAFGLEQLIVKQNTGDVTCRASVHGGEMSIRTTTGDIYLSSLKAGDVTLAASTGDIRVENSAVKSLNITVTTGRVTASSVICEGETSILLSTGKTSLTDLTCHSLKTSGGTGDLTLRGVCAATSLSIERSTGDVRLDGCDAAEIVIKTDTGDVTGALLSEKAFTVKTDTGRTSLPASTEGGGRCEITTNTGDIRISLQPK